MKMIQDIWCYNFRVAVISNDGQLDVHVSVCLEKTDINVKGTGAWRRKPLMSRVIHKDGPVAAVEMPEDKLWGMCRRG